jgi:5-methylthioadenosine/S-adenosylhomocysteine deaminase
MEQCDILLLGDQVLTMDDRMTILRDGGIAIKGTTIIAAGQREELLKRFRPATILPGDGRVLLPGLINTHTHAAMVYFRGLADDLPLKVWLEEHIWPAEGRWLSPGFIGDAVGLACLEMLKAGVTTYNDMYFFGDSAAEATKRMGMRGVLGVGILDFPTVSAQTTDEYFSNAGRFIDAWKDDPLITPCVAPHAAYTCGPDTLRRANALAELRDVPLHIHLSETEWEVQEILNRYGKRPVEHLESIGFLSERVVAAHCVWPDEREIGLLAQRKVGVAHCMESNLKLASGIAPVPAMLRAGVRVTFGTDGAASNNDLSVLGDMATAAKVHKAIAKDPTAIDAKTALLMATRWGAEAIGLGSKIGSIEAGKEADVIAIDIRKPHLVPMYDVCSHLVYSALSSDVTTVMVRGKVLVDKGRHVLADEEEILAKAAWWQSRIAGTTQQ